MEPNSEKLTVYVVDDNEDIRELLKVLIDSMGHDVQTFANALDFLDVYQPRRPGCLVLDLRLPGMSGLTLQERLIKDRMNLPIIFISGHADVSAATVAMKNGAIDFIEKPFTSQILLDRIQDAIAQSVESYRQREEVDQLSRRFKQLTPREHQVLDLIVAGRLNKQIAGDLGLSEKTVETHRAQIMRKLHVDHVAPLVKMAVAVKGAQKSLQLTATDNI